jgi:hypothetical protein
VALAVGAGAWAASLQADVDGLEDANVRLRLDATRQSDQFGTMGSQLVQESARNVQLSDTQDAVIEIVSQADVARLPLAGTAAAPLSSGRYIWSATSEKGALVAIDMPPLAQGRSYCLWFVHERAWRYAGRFDVDPQGRGAAGISLSKTCRMSPTQEGSSASPCRSSPPTARGSTRAPPSSRADSDSRHIPPGKHRRRRPLDLIRRLT